MPFTEEDKRDLFDRLEAISKEQAFQRNELRQVKMGLYGSVANDAPGVIERVKKVEKFHKLIIRWYWTAQGAIAAAMYGIIEWIKHIEIK